MIKKNLPFGLVIFRLLLAPVMLIWTFQTHESGWLLVACLWAGMLSDIFDGIIARKLGVATTSLRKWDANADIVFWLMEAPDKEACAAVHREAHGAMPCNVIELQGGDYLTYMGNENKANEFDIVLNGDGTLDAGYRMIMAADLISITGNNDLLQETANNIIAKHEGRILNSPGNRAIIIFTTGAAAMKCAANIIEATRSLPDETIEVRIGISAGEPVTAQQDIFADAIQLANRLCDIAQNNHVVVSSLAKALTPRSNLSAKTQQTELKILNAEDEQFLNALMSAVNELLSQEDFSIDTLSETVGMSRSGLYRKITELTGRSANAFLHELRMQKALRLLRNKHGNVTQVALEAGFNNPSYFAKSFQKRFGILPFKAARLQS